MTDGLTEADIIALGYEYPRRLPDGRWIAIMPLMYTTGLVVDIDRTSWRTRFCYEHRFDAINALNRWDGQGDPPGPWIKQKPEERLNPEWAKENDYEEPRL